MNKNKILIAGYARSGKDSLADAFVKKGYKKFSFASALKEYVSELIGISIDEIKKSTLIIELTDEEILKITNKYFSVLINDEQNQLILKMIKDEFRGKDLKYIFEGRHTLQYIATEIFRNQIDNNFWVNILKENIKFESKIVISDYRFFSEEIEGFYKIRLKRKNLDISNLMYSHASEVEIPKLPINLEIEIDESKNIEDKMRKIVKNILSY